MRGCFFRRGVGVFAAVTIAMSAMSGAQAATPAVAPQVVGGQDVSISDVPWQVLFIIEDSIVCGGAFVSPTQVVSAAHCFADFRQDEIQAWAGITNMSDRSNASSLSIASITQHPDYVPDTYANDIALVTLSAPVSARLGVRAIGLPVNEDAATWPATGTTAIVSGWGETDPNVLVASDPLQAGTVQVLASPSDATCGLYGAVYLPREQVCAGLPQGGVDACEGDSGSALTVFVNGEPVMAGIASAGAGCANEGFPGLYVRVTSYLDWLAANGVDLQAAGSSSTVTVPGTNRDGVPADFAIGVSYPTADFARLAGLPARARLTITGGRACTRDGRNVAIVRDGKCFIRLKAGRKTARVIVTVYAV